MIKHRMHSCHYFGKQIIRTYFSCTDKCFPLVRFSHPTSWSVLAIYSQLFFEASLRLAKSMALYDVPVLHIQFFKNQICNSSKNTYRYAMC